MLNNIVDVSEQNWDSEVMKSSVPVVVDFWADWCAPCKTLNPILYDVAELLGDKIKIVKVNCETSQSLASANNIRSIPALFLVKDGKIQKRQIGFINKAALLHFIGNE
jgi:thioredoxin 1